VPGYGESLAGGVQLLVEKFRQDYAARSRFAADVHRVVVLGVAAGNVYLDILSRLVYKLPHIHAQKLG
jgi:hypothetical protein